MSRFAACERDLKMISTLKANLLRGRLTEQHSNLKEIGTSIFTTYGVPK